MKELSQFDSKKPEGFESEFDHFDAVKCTFRIFGGWQAVSLGGDVTIMEKREILVGG